MTRLDLYHHSGRNSYRVLMAAINIGLTTPLEEHCYDAVASEITRMHENPIPAGIQDRAHIPLQAPRFERVVEEAPAWEDII